MIGRCSGVSTDFKGIVPGEAVWMQGHIGIYIGGGKVVEATSAWDSGVQISACGNLGTISGLHTRSWTKHGRLPWVDYSTATITTNKAAAATTAEEEDDMVRYKKLADIPNDYGARTVIDTLMTAQIVNGDGSDKTGNGDVIDLSDDQVRILVMNYRGGAYDRKLVAMGMEPAVS